MKILDPGHAYHLDVFDGAFSDPRETLTFMKREGPGYPGNVGHHPGTNCQEVLRALIDRVEYLDAQISHGQNAVVLGALRNALLAFEVCALQRRERIETLPACSKCGHMACDCSP